MDAIALGDGEIHPGVLVDYDGPRGRWEMHMDTLGLLSGYPRDLHLHLGRLNTLCS